jgi:energy-coupling factor transporter ATP-binding protein EcfA2
MATTCEFTLDSLRAQMSMVLQETILFSGSVVENIAYGRPDATWAEILTAAKQANAQEFIERMPEGYYTLLGERGANLSGGQRQRIAIARAFIRNTPILILDEPTTGLDAESTELVLRALKALMNGKTTIIISHDLSLIRNADKIVVIKNGEIEQIGTHESLLEAGGLYANLYMKQTGQTEERPALEPGRPPTATWVGRPLEEAEGKVAGNALIDDAHIDLPHSPSMLSRLPALGPAFDGPAMREYLQPVLFGKNNTSFSIESCKPGKAIYLPENVCAMQYDLQVRDTETGQIHSFVINARLFPSLEDAERYRMELLASGCPGARPS